MQAMETALTVLPGHFGERILCVNVICNFVDETRPA